MSDPFQILGVGRDVSLSEVRAARRRLAFDTHPDRGGDADRMRTLNTAFDAVVAHVTGRRLIAETPPRQGTGAQTASGDHTAGGATRQRPDDRRPGHPARPGWRVASDMPSFVIEALPVVAFEALLIATAIIGELLVDEPPYMLEAYLNEPEPCWCRLELVPDAGSSTVSLIVAGIDGAPAPDPEVVRDVWIRELNAV